MIGMKVLFYSVGAERSEAQHREPLFFLSARTFGSFAPSVFTQTLRVMKLNPTTAFNIKHNLSVCGWEDQIKNVFSKKKKKNSSAAHMPIDGKGLLFSQAFIRPDCADNTIISHAEAIWKCWLSTKRGVAA